MRDYHCFSLEDPETGLAHDEGVILSVEDIPWAGRQLWDNDVVEKDGRYYLIFCLKDRHDIFRLGVATSRPSRRPFPSRSRTHQEFLQHRPLRVQGRRRTDLRVFRRTVGRTVAEL